MYARSKECRSTSALLEVNGKTTITSPAFDAYRFVSRPASCRTVMACGVGSRARSKWQPPRAVTTVLDDEHDGLFRDEESLFGLLIGRAWLRRQRRDGPLVAIEPAIAGAHRPRAPRHFLDEDSRCKEFEWHGGSQSGRACRTSGGRSRPPATDVTVTLVHYDSPPPGRRFLPAPRRWCRAGGVRYRRAAGAVTLSARRSFSARAPSVRSDRRGR